MKALARPHPHIAEARRFPSVSSLCTFISLLAMMCPRLANGLQLSLTHTPFIPVYQWLTCHLTHWSWNHYVWDIGLFVPLAWYLEQKHKKQFLWCLLLACVAVSCSVVFCLPSLTGYRGLSGIDSALFSLVLLILTREFWGKKDWTNWGICLIFYGGFFLKTGYETICGQTVFVSASTQMTPVPLAHFIGFLTGTFTGLFIHEKKKTY